ncbi:MAG: T9SS type A sorting domain-containing protein [Saprospiraceae bacterium]|nr:T9SS type A sorting domain-containing protein [Saprospiraceae bacterium]
MKKLFCLFTFFIPFLATPVTAQYLPFVDENKFWIYNHYNDADIPAVTSGFLVRFEGDTLMSGFTYKKVLQQQLSGSHPCPPAQQPCFVIELPYKTLDKKVIGYIREEEPVKQVFYLPVENSFCGQEEFLLFDFSLVTGATLTACQKQAIGNQANFGIVDSVGIVTSYGKERNTLFTTGFVTYLGLPFIGVIELSEGLGFNRYGFFYEANSRNELADFCEGNITVSCSVLSEITEAQRSKQDWLNLSGIIRDKLVIRTEERVTSLQLFDLSGQRLSVDTGTETLDMSGLSAGLYFIKIQWADGQMSVQKIIKL